MTSILSYARLSQAVYSNTPTADGWTLANFRPGLGTSLQAAAFTFGQTKVVAFKGTTPSDVSDIVADLKLGTGMNTSYFSDAEEFVERYAPGPDVVFTGHSLGGAIAQVVGNRRRMPFVTFNAPGVAVLASRNLLSTSTTMMTVRLAGSALSAFRHPLQMISDVRSAFHVSLGVNFRLSADLVSQIGLHYGKVVSIQGQGNPLAQHGIGNMIAALERFPSGNIHFPR